MSGYLQRLASSAMNPRESMHPMLVSVFSPPTYRRTPESFQTEDTVPSVNWPESPVTPQPEEDAPSRIRPEFAAPAPAERILRGAGPETGPSTSNVPPFETLTSASERAGKKDFAEPVPEEKTSFKLLVNKGQQVKSAAVPSVRMNYKAGGLDEPNTEVVTPGRDAASIFQSAGPEPVPSVSITPPFATAEKKVRAEPVPEERISFKPLVNKGPQAEKAAGPPITMNYEAGGLDEPNPEPVTPGRDAVRASQNAGREPLLSVTSDSAEARQTESAEPVSKGGMPYHTLVAKVQQREVKEREVVLKGSYKPLMAENLRRADPPTVLPEASKPITADTRKQEKRDLSRSLRQPEREPSEIQIHIGRIEVTAVPPAPARPEVKPASKSLNLDEYLKRRNGRAG